MPTWGQLGCSGFIVIDSHDNVVCDKSAAYLEVKEDAFRHVEMILDSLLNAEGSSKPVSASFPVPQPVQQDNKPCGGACAQVRFGTQGQETTTQALPTPVESVKVQVLDDEHHECETQLAVLGNLLETGERTGETTIERNKLVSESLCGLLKAYESHFAHEETLLDKYLYAEVAQDTRSGFSADKGARTSHFADHQAMLSKVRSLIEDLSLVDLAAIRGLQQDFHQHATRYDGSYADRLSVAMTKA